MFESDGIVNPQSVASISANPLFTHVCGTTEILKQETPEVSLRLQRYITYGLGTPVGWCAVL